MAVSPF